LETLGPIDGLAVSFLSGLGRRIADVSRETLEGSFLFRRLSVLVQRFKFSAQFYLKYDDDDDNDDDTS